MPQTLLDKIWEAHEVAPGLLYIDLHLVHEVTSPQAFDGLRLAGRGRAPPRSHARDRRPQRADRWHDARRGDQRRALARAGARRSSATAREFGVPLYSMGSDRQGIVHVIGPELGVTQPGMTIVCGDSHTATHGAFGALAFGIGTSEVEHVLATQCLVQTKPRAMRIRYEGDAGFGVTAKDLILATIGQMGVAGAVGHVVEYSGPGDLGALDGGPDDGLQHDDRGRRPRRHGRPRRGHLRVVRAHRAARASGAARAGRDDRGLARAAQRRRARTFDTRGASSTRRAISPQVTWGTNPGMVVGVAGACPRPTPSTRPPTARRPSGRCATWALERRHADRRDPPRPRLHRLVHELAHRRPARGRRR